MPARTGCPACDSRCMLRRRSGSSAHRGSRRSSGRPEWLNARSFERRSRHVAIGARPVGEVVLGRCVTVVASGGRHVVTAAATRRHHARGRVAAQDQRSAARRSRRSSGSGDSCVIQHTCRLGVLRPSRRGRCSDGTPGTRLPSAWCSRARTRRRVLDVDRVVAVGTASVGNLGRVHGERRVAVTWTQTSLRATNLCASRLSEPGFHVAVHAADLVVGAGVPRVVVRSHLVTGGTERRAAPCRRPLRPMRRSSMTPTIAQTIHLFTDVSLRRLIPE